MPFLEKMSSRVFASSFGDKANQLLQSLLWEEALKASMGGELVFRGKAWVYGDLLEADWHIISLERLAEIRQTGLQLTAAVLGKYCLEKVDPEFVLRVSPGDFIVAGENLGYSYACLDGNPDDPHFIGAASLAIKGSGVGAVLCESSGMNFFLNSVNLGLPVIECRGIRGKVGQGDELCLDLAAGTIVNLTSGEEIGFSPYPEFLLQLVRSGGLYPHLAEEALGRSD